MIYSGGVPLRVFAKRTDTYMAAWLGHSISLGQQLVALHHVTTSPVITTMRTFFFLPGVGY
jgi:hypothetical protein